MKTKEILGLTEFVTMIGPNGKKKRLIARVDTGATKSSVDVRISAELQLGPIIRHKKVKSASGNHMRPVVKAQIKLNNRIFNEEFTIADRAHMRYKVLLGQNVLKHNFLIDPLKKKK